MAGILQLITPGLHDSFLVGSDIFLISMEKTTLVVVSNSGIKYTIRDCPLESKTTLTLELIVSNKKSYNIVLNTGNEYNRISFKANSDLVNELNEFCRDGKLTYTIIEMFIASLSFVPLSTTKVVTCNSMDEFYAKRKPVTMIDFLGTQIPKALYEHMHTAITLAEDVGGMLTLDDIPEHLKPHAKDAMRALNKSNRYAFTIENMAVYDFLGLLDTLAEWGTKKGVFIDGDEIKPLTRENAFNAGYVIEDTRSVPYIFSNAHKHIRDKKLLNSNIIRLLEPYKRLKELTRNMKLGEIDIIALTQIVNEK